MTKKKNSKPKAKKKATPKKQAHPGLFTNEKVRKFCLFSFFTLVAVMGFLAAGKAISQTVTNDYALVNTPYLIEFDDTPSYITNEVLLELGKKVSKLRVPYDSPELCKCVYDELMKSPWIESVESVKRVEPKLVRFQPRKGAQVNRVQKSYKSYRGSVKIVAKFREPIAMVWSKHPGSNQYHYVDAKGVRLPEKQVPYWKVYDGKKYHYYLRSKEYKIPRHFRKQRVHYVRIDGVLTAPREIGVVWKSVALPDALKLASIVKNRFFADQISVIDVGNYNHRNSDADSEIVMIAQKGRSSKTRILFGRFPRNKGADYVITPAKKFAKLEEFIRENGNNIAGVCYELDLRHEWLGRVKNHNNLPR